MAKFSQPCSRCNEIIDGEFTVNFTTGFYDVSRAGWHKYAKPGESVLCDCCMWQDPRYIADYGNQNLEGCGEMVHNRKTPIQ